MNDYLPAEGSQLSKRAAKIVGRELEAIRRRHGKLSAEMVLEDARLRTSPLHRFFEWNRVKAARQWNLEQARLLLRSVRVVIVSGKTVARVRGFYAVNYAAGRRAAYVPARDAMSGPIRAQIVLRGLADARSWLRQYEIFDELRCISGAIRVALRQKRGVRAAA